MVTRHSRPPIQFRFTVTALALAALALLSVLRAEPAAAQSVVPGRNVNMVSGTKWPTGDPYLQRQNEPSVAASTRNPLHLLAGANDYRTVDIPFVSGADETGDAWLGLFKSFDGGQRWQSNLIPGYPQDTTATGLASPLKGYLAGADPVVRAGANGLLYYSGLVFDRGTNAKSAVFVSRFIDNNNKENGDPIVYLGTSIIASDPGTSGVFLDKPWFAVDVPRLLSPVCRVVTQGDHAPITQTFQGGTAYAAFTRLSTDAQGLKSEILFSRSFDCGASWSRPVVLSRAQDRINQGASIAIDPRNGQVYVAWRRISSSPTDAGDGILVVKVPLLLGLLPPFPVSVHQLPRTAGLLQAILDRFFEHRLSQSTTQLDAGLESFDQATSDIDQFLSFRTNAYPSMTVDASGRVYVAWSERGFGSVHPGADGDARIVVATSANGLTWSTPRAVAEEGQAGHQIMPTLTFGGGKLALLYYDLREDVSGIFSKFVDDKTAIDFARRRHTLDLRASYGTPGNPPVFAPSQQVSDYLAGSMPGDAPGTNRQLQYNPPNLPMFKLGTAPFIGDYVDVAPAPAFVPAARGRWTYNTSSSLPVFQAVWTDNRDVRPPSLANDTNGDGNPWNDYTPPTQRTGASLFDPSRTLSPCDPALTGSRNQNVYSARLTPGLVVGSPGNAKPLSATLQRAFVVFAQNTTSSIKAFRLTILNQPQGGHASFDQFMPTLTTIDVTTPPRSVAARSVYATSSDPSAQIQVTVVEIPQAGAPTPVPGGLSGTIILNPDIANPDIANPDIANPDIANPDIANAEVYNPDIANPDIANPDIANPDIANPDIANPDIANPDIANPDIANPDIANVEIANPDIANPDIANPDIANPDIANPDIANPDIANQSLADVTWTITNTGNTTAAYNVNLFLAQQTDRICAASGPSSPDCIATQLILRKVYNTPTATGCTIEVQSQNVVVANIRNPRFVTPATPTLPGQNDPSATNATVWLAPGETAKITLRVADPHPQDNVPAGGGTIDPIFVPTTQDGGGLLTPIISAQGVSTEDAANGVTHPPIETPVASSVFFVQQPTTEAYGLPIAPAVVVQVRDRSGAVLSGAAVTLTLGANPTGASLAGGGPVATDAAGLATFPAVSVDRVGTGYTLLASVAVPGVSSITSAAFDVRLVVTSTADSGAGTLRNALQFANATPGVKESIAFDIPGPVPHVIELTSPLPPVTDPVILDATTQPDYDGRPTVEVSGAHTPAGTYGLEIQGGNSMVRGLAITSFPAEGIFAWSGNMDAVMDNYLGTDRDGNPGKGNLAGIRLRASNHQVARNVISGNVQNGILVEGGTQDWIGNNSIGTTPAGTAALPNGWSGITMYDDPKQVQIVGNLISGNTAWGVDLQAYWCGGAPACGGGDYYAGSEDTLLGQNWIGIDAAGNALGNGSGGLRVNTSPRTVIGLADNGNVISGNAGPGIVILGTVVDPSTVRGNKIGTDPTGAFARPNAGEGLFVDYRAQGHVIGGLLPGEGNQVSGNTGAGIKIWGNATIVQGNLIGTGPDGLAALPNGSMGVHVEFGQHNTIGGAAAGSRNVISGNTGPGVLIGGLTSYLPTPSTANTIAGNYIGLSATGAAPLPNGAEGINLRESAGGTIVQDNVVSASTGFGITLFDGTSGNTIRHNWIGTDPAGAIVAGFGNAAGGVGLWNAATGNTIGGATAADGNVIAGNGGPGIAVLATGTTASTGGSFLANSIVGNAGLGIDLGGDGVTANDPSDGDAGPNRLQNAPVLLGIANSPTETQVGFSINSVPLKTYTLEFFASSACDPSGRGQGQRPVARTTAATNFFGNAGGTLLMPELLAPGTIVTATATDDAGNTSEFSNCAVLVDVPGTAGGTANVNFPGGVSAAGGTDPVNSGIFVNAGGQVTISATGSVDFGGLIYGPNGSGGGTARPEFLATSASEWSLVGRIGSGPWQAIGAGPTTLTAGSAGALQLATNDSWYGDPNTGDFFAAVTFGAAAGGSPIFTTAGVGNLGHNDFPPIDCGPGSYGVALRGRAGDDIDQTQLWCSPLSGGVLGAATLAGSVGGGGGSDYGATLSCPANSVMTGIHGMAGQVIWGGTVVDSLGVTCTDLSTGTIVTSPTVGLETPLYPGSTTPYAISCPAGMAVAGIAGGQGGLLDWIGLRCR